MKWDLPAPGKKCRGTVRVFQPLEPAQDTFFIFYYLLSMMETVGKFEFNRKDLIGHGAFAVVFKGRHKEKRDWVVAVKCINKKNLAKSQSLLGKEIKILKELKHENIVRLLDYQEMGGCVYLVMEYCNGGDLAEYLHSKGTLSEDTIRVFLQQIGQAMKVLQIKGILHRDLKPQNILLCHPERRRSSPINTCIKIADFGFARHLQMNTMAATLCGSPMYMAPEVIMSQNYDAKADLWSIGTIVYQCLTGKAPFHASTPQELRLFYESNRTLLPSIPKETSPNLRHLLLGMLQRNHKQRIGFDEFFRHPFMETCSPTKKSPVPSYPSSGSASSSGSSSTSHPASPQHSDGEMHRLQPKVQYSPPQDTPGFLLKEIANQDSRNTSSYTEDYVMVPAQFPSDCTCELEVGSLIDSCLIYSGSPLLAERGPRNAGKTPPPSPLLHSPSKPVSKPVEIAGRICSPSVPIPVPTQIQNYQRMEQNLQPVGLHGSTRVTLCGAGSSSPLCGGSRAPSLNSPRLATGGARPQQPSPLVGMTPKTTEQTLPLSTRTGLLADMQDTSSPKQLQSRMPNRIRTVLDLQSLDPSPAYQTNFNRKSDDKKGPFKRSLSTGRLSDMLLKAAFGAHLFEEGSDESLNCEKGMDITAPPTGCHRGFQYSDSPPPAVFTMGSLSRGNTPPDPAVPRMFSDSPSYINSAWLLNSRLNQGGSRRNSETEAMDATPHISLVFHPPELPEDTLMEQAHTDALSDLRFTLAFVHCVMELASSKDPGLDAVSSPDVSFLEQSLVTDQISLLSREWSYAEQLVLYMKAEEFLSSALHTAKETIKQGRLLPSATVKQVIRKLNELYKSCVTYCRSLNLRLQTFLFDKQKLMDRFNGLTAEKLIYTHTVHMVQCAALDEMFHYGTASVQRYQKALLLMEGLSRIITEQKDSDSIDKCKQCIERRLSALQT
ncbi:serine/threonine-protein kinase ULK1a isoform X3 [Sebastes umbrosus]|uniref:serine/threonine-protein kinase ULK1a isoform X3 n=1 Tax=Sebastes umbrosus TaxID=72105 RepID=UPI00189FCE01|nr:serine/threonine-protein kinase ULK1a isoform X3 [Sebastes umbrosus]